MILVLEDEEWRAKFFRERLKADLVTTGGAEIRRAIERGYQAGRRDIVVYLDHDLGRGFNGNDVAKALVTDFGAYEGPRGDRAGKVRFVVHSMNPVGAERIVATLRDAGLNVQRIPFGDLLQQHGWNVPDLTPFVASDG